MEAGGWPAANTDDDCGDGDDRRYGRCIVRFGVVVGIGGGFGRSGDFRGSSGGGGGALKESELITLVKRFRA